MQALTIWQPWAWAISAGIKLVENRDWLPNWRLLSAGDELAIHSAMRAPTRDDYRAMRVAAEASGFKGPFPAFDSHELGANFGQGRIVAVAKFTGIAHSLEDVPVAQRPWWVGRKGWLLEDVRQLNLGSAPKVKGQQGLWALPVGVEDLVRAQLKQPEGQLWRRTA